MKLKRIVSLVISTAFALNYYQLSAKLRQKPKNKNRQSTVKIDFDAESAKKFASQNEKKSKDKNTKENNVVDVTEEEIQIEDTKLKISREHLTMSHAEKKKLFKSMTPDQFLDFMEDHAVAMQKLEEQEVSLKEKDIKIKNLEKEIETIKNTPKFGSGELANEAFIQKIKKEGIDTKKLDFRVQIGSFTSYDSAVSIENKARKMNLPTFIVVRYEGFVIPIKLVLDHIKKK